MQLKDALRQKGYRVIDLWERLNRKYLIDYQLCAKYARCNTRNCLDPVVWEKIDECLKEMEVVWNG